MDISSDIVTVSFADIKYDELIDNLVKAAQLKNYRVTKIVNVDHIKDQKDYVEDFTIPFEHYKIVEICNLVYCNKVIASDFLAGVFMPVRFVVYRPNADKQIYVSYLKPTAFARLFKSKQMDEIAQVMEKDMIAITDSADF